MGGNTYGRILSRSWNPSIDLTFCPRDAKYLSLVQVMCTFSWYVSVSSSSSEPMLVKRSIEFRSFTSCAWGRSNSHSPCSFPRALTDWEDSKVSPLCRALSWRGACAAASGTSAPSSGCARTYRQICHCHAVMDTHKVGTQNKNALTTHCIFTR